MARRKKEIAPPRPAPDILVWRRAEGIGSITELADKLRSALEAGRPLTIELSEAGDPDSAVLQLLVSASRAGDALVLRNPSPAFVDGCSTLGLFSVLMSMPMEASE
jgi:anti-anti-sigma regulatory factor